MLSTHPLKTYRKSYGKLARSGSFNPGELERVIDTLAEGKALPRHYKDHALTGTLAGFRDCHIGFDLVLIYRITSDGILILADIGTHSELFG
ncbi:MAG: type II toxin-antitoxin system YafQ family toxin [Candidatus Paceibacterota bacterium]|jgi:mRNA interferase YafQ